MHTGEVGPGFCLWEESLTYFEELDSYNYYSFDIISTIEHIKISTYFATRFWIPMFLPSKMKLLRHNLEHKKYENQEDD